MNRLFLLSLAIFLVSCGVSHPLAKPSMLDPFVLQTEQRLARVIVEGEDSFEGLVALQLGENAKVILMSTQMHVLAQSDYIDGHWMPSKAISAQVPTIELTNMILWSLASEQQLAQELQRYEAVVVDGNQGVRRIRFERQPLELEYNFVNDGMITLEINNASRITNVSIELVN